jgi:carbon-monoxide dehydrogenase large subunit
MNKFAVGQPYRRTEDPRLLTGHGRYVADIALAGEVYAVIVRSPHAHARLGAIDTAAAATAPGVLAVYTGADCAADGLGDLPCIATALGRDGKDAHKPLRPVLARMRVRFVGDNVAMVVAETVDAARDAAELINVEYETLPAVTGTAEALEAGAPAVHDEAPGNLALCWEKGDAAATDAAFAGAARVVSLDIVNNRVVPNPMEPRAVVGNFDAETGRYLLYTPSQKPHFIRDHLAQSTLKVPPEDIRVVTPDVGGAFGTKLFHYAEEVLVLWASKKLGRPVKWVGERADSFLCDTHGRDHVSRAELALDADGRFLGLRVRTTAAMGAYLNTFAPFVVTEAGAPMLAGVYATPAIHLAVEGSYTNTVPVDAYRGAGRPEAIYVIERLVDAAARECGLEADEIRRRNFISSADMPYETPLGKVYDSGEFARNMDDAMANAGWEGFAERREDARKRGRLRGIGMALYIESCGGGSEEEATIEFGEDGTVEVLVGTQSAGHGHETAYAQIAADALGVPFEAIRVHQGDTDRVPFGGGTGGSRSIPIGGAAVAATATAIVAKGKDIAARLLQASSADIEFFEGRFRVGADGRSLTIAEVAAAARDPENVPNTDTETETDTDAGPEARLWARERHNAETQTFPNGCHICEVEIDPDTGALEIVAFTVVDDFGNMINPALVGGQIHGGVVQGVGQALLEEVVYDNGSGQLLNASFMDYAMPRADDVPAIEVTYSPVPCTTNPLGVKGAGEAGAVGSAPAVINAVVNALEPLGVRHIDMPATPEKIWRAIQGANHTKGAAK